MPVRRIPFMIGGGKSLSEDLREAIELARRCSAQLNLLICEAEQLLYQPDRHRGHEPRSRARRLLRDKTRNPSSRNG